MATIVSGRFAIGRLCCDANRRAGKPRVPWESRVPARKADS